MISAVCYTVWPGIVVGLAVVRDRLRKKGRA